jgi:predicted MFS family arabinose efflux permease
VRFRDQLRALPPAVWILLGGTLVNRFGQFVMPFLAIYLTRIGYSTARAGLAVGAYGAGHIIASSLGGHLADRIGRRNTIVLSMFGSAAAMLALSQMRSYGWIVALTTITAAMAELYRPASHALLTDLVAPEHRAFAFALYRFAVNLGVAAGPALAGFMAEHSFFYLFVGDAATSLIYGVIAVIALPHGLRTYQKGERVGEALRSALRDTAFVTFLTATFLVAMVDLQMLSTLPLHVTSIGFAPRVYGMLVSLNAALVITLELFITNYTQRMSPRPVIALGFLLWGLGFALTGIARTIPLLAITVTIWTLGEIVSSPMVAAHVAQIAPERFRGRYMGMLTTTWSIAMMIGPPLGTFAFERNPAALWAGCGVIALISLAFLYTPRRPET